VNLEAIKRGISNSKVVLWPGSTVEVVIRILSKQEAQEAFFAAEQRFIREKVQVQLHNLEEFHEERAIQQLVRAVRDVDGGGTLATSVEVFRSLISRDDVDRLTEIYSAFEDEVGGNLESASEEEIDLLLSELKKKPEQVLGSVSNIGTLKRLLRSLVAPPAT
jgi:hypothetical protein